MRTFAGRLDVRGARPSFDKAYQYGRGNADIVLLYAALRCTSPPFPGGARRHRLGAALDPSTPVRTALRVIAYASRRYADAIAQAQRALELNPKMSNANATIGDSLMMLGKLADARAAYLKEPSAMFRCAAWRRWNIAPATSPPPIER